MNDLRKRWEDLRPVGFWWSDAEPHLPHPRDFVDPSWDTSERAAVLAYLAKGIPAPFEYLGFSWCRLCAHDDLFAQVNGSGEFTDGAWRWPEGLTHHVGDHWLSPTGNSSHGCSHMLDRSRRPVEWQGNCGRVAGA